MSESIRRIWEQQEALRRAVDPLGDMRRLIDPLGDAYSRLGIGADTMRFLHEQEEQQKLLSGVVDGYRRAELDTGTLMRMAEEAERHRKLLEGPIDEARRIGLLDPHSDIRRAMAAAIETHQAYERLFRLPAVDEISRLARDAAGEGTLAALMFARDGLDVDLRAQMEAMRHPWLKIEQFDRSAAAFAEMQAIGRALNQRPPFEAALAASLRPNLGDWRDVAEPTRELLRDPLLRFGYYLERGFNPALTEFTVPAFEESVGLAGLREPDSEWRPALEDEENEDGLARNRAAFDQLQRFEIAMRRFIEQAMHAAYGDGWIKHRLPGDMLDRWHAKKEAALKAGEAERPLIDYADFTDYRVIIERNDNWNTVFKPIFGRAEDVRESFQRLFPVRIATMHARIITLDDEMLLIVETKRILRAIRKSP